MPRVRRALRGLAFALVAGSAGAAMSACGGGDPNSVEGGGRVATVQISEPAVTLGLGTTLALQLVVRDASGAVLNGRPVAWSSSDPAIVTVSNTGVITAVGTGTAQVAATVDGRSAVTNVTVAQRAVAQVQVSAPGTSLLVGGRLQLSARTLDDAGGTLDGRRVAWRTSDATIASVDNNGLVIGLAPGVVTITADAEGKTGTVGLSIALVPVASVSLAPASETIVVGQTTQLTAIARDSIGGELTGRTVAWSSSNVAVATVTSAGLVLGIAPGEVTVTAGSGGRTAEARVVVQPRPVGSVIVSPGQVALIAGGSLRLDVQVTDGNGNPLLNRPVQFRSGNSAIATVSSDGVVTGVATGSTSLVVSSEGRETTVPVTVSAIPVASVRVAPGTASLVVGDSIRLTAVATSASGATLTGRPVTWSSGAPSVAVVGANGTVTGVAPGTALVIANVEGRVATAEVQVSAAPVGAVSVSPTSMTVIVGEFVDLTATVRDASGSIVSGRPIFWQSSNESVAVVSSAGRVRTIATGSVRITASADGMSGTADLQVIPEPVTGVNVSPATLTLFPAGTATIVATPVGASGPLARPVTFTSSNTAVATVSASGVVTAVRVGSATITASSEGRSATVSVNVIPIPVASVTVTLSSGSVAAGGAVTATAVARDAAGNVLDGRTVTWSSSNTDVATVSATGTVTAVAPGTTNIVATVEGKTGNASLAVTPAPVATVVVSLAEPTIRVGGSTQATATPRSAAGLPLTDRTVTWSSSNAAVATVSATGVVTGVTPGNATITATSEGRSGTASVSVTVVPVASVSVSLGDPSLIVGATTTATAVARDAGGAALTGRAVVWSSSNTAVATVNANGTVTAVAAGTANIIATSEGKSGSAAVTVSPPAPTPVATVSVTLGTSSLTIGATTTATATLQSATGAVLTGRAVTWSSSNPLVALVSTSGVVTALLPGTATITATSEGKSGSAAVTVTLVPISSVSVTLADPSLVVGATTLATAVVRDAAGNTLSGRAVVWNSTNTAVATVTADGTVTAVGAGTASIRATSEGRTGSATVTVSAPPPAPVATVTVGLADASIDVGSTTTATATLRDAAGNTLSGRAVAWSSTDATVATVSATGAISALKAGTTTIRATSEGRSGTATLTVTSVAVASVGVTVADPSLIVGATTTATAAVRDAAGNALTGRAVVWSSTNTAVATVSAGGVVTAVGVGTASIRATSEGRTGSATVTVSAPPPAPVATVTVGLADASIEVGSTTSATATVRDAAGNTLTGRSVTWSSTDATVATVSATGAITALKIGTTTIRATSEGKSGTATLTVTAPAVARVEVSPSTARIFVDGPQGGRFVQLSAKAFDAQDREVTGRAVSWSSSRTSVAVVSSTGRVTSVNEGTAVITATVDGQSDSATITVDRR